MGYKSVFLKPYIRSVAQSISVKSRNAIKDQQRIFGELIKSAKKTSFGVDHDFANISNEVEYKARVAVRSYEDLEPYINRIISGEKDVLWPGKPKYLAKTSGTTSGAKYIPLTKASAPMHISSARTALFNYSYEWKNDSIWDGKMIFLSGSPKLEKVGGIQTGRLSGIVNHMVPAWIKPNQLPSYRTNCIEGWEQKVDQIVEDTINQDMRLVSGIPPWIIMYFERLIEASGKGCIKDIFPEFSTLFHGGVNFDPYKNKLQTLIGGNVDYVETYPASEGFIGMQYSREDQVLLLNTFSGIYYEFIRTSDLHESTPIRYSLEEVERDVNYAIVISTNAGLWSYLIGDTVSFTSTSPFLIKVTGRIKHYLSAFGEHVIGSEVDQSLSEVIDKYKVRIREFTVAPQVNPKDNDLPYHEWYIEFDQDPHNIDELAADLDLALRRRNDYYDDLVRGHIIRPLVIRQVPKHTFVEYMKSKGKLGGQHKLPRLSNDRSIVDVLSRSVEDRKDKDRSGELALQT